MPNVDENEDFWAQGTFESDDTLVAGYTDDQATLAGFTPITDELETVCVTEPSA